MPALVSGGSVGIRIAVIPASSRPFGGMSVNDSLDQHRRRRRLRDKVDNRLIVAGDPYRVARAGSAFEHRRITEVEGRLDRVPRAHDDALFRRHDAGVCRRIREQEFVRRHVVVTRVAERAHDQFAQPCMNRRDQTWRRIRDHAMQKRCTAIVARNDQRRILGANCDGQRGDPQRIRAIVGKVANAPGVPALGDQRVARGEQNHVEAAMVQRTRHSGCRNPVHFRNNNEDRELLHRRNSGKTGWDGHVLRAARGCRQRLLAHRVGRPPALNRDWEASA